jgi:hypothetical protein
MSDIELLLIQAIKDIAEHGFDSPERIEKWVNALRRAAGSELGSPEEIEGKIRASLKAVYERNVIQGSILKRHPKVSTFTLRNIEPQLRVELHNRILASANLIKLNREKTIEQILQRFSGWATSIPAGGSEVVDRREVKKGVIKSLRQMSFEERRVAIDQGHKLISNISAVVAIETGAIAATWHQHFTQNPRKCHTERDGKVYAIRGNWPMGAGYMKKGAGYTDEFEQPAEFPFCRCDFEYLINLRDVPPEMLTRKGKEYLEN